MTPQEKIIEGLKELVGKLQSDITRLTENFWRHKHAGSPIDSTTELTADVLSAAVTAPAGSDTQVQFNDGGVFGAVSSFLWDKTNKILTIGVEAFVSALAAPDATTNNTAGGGLTIYSGGGNGSGAGGNVDVAASGGGATGAGGSVSLSAGTGGATSGNGGNVDITAGTVTSGAEGKVRLYSGYLSPSAAYTPGVAGTATLNLSLANEHRITMPAGNATIALANDEGAQKFIISITQDSGGSRTVTWFTTIKWAGGVAPTLTTTASKRDTFGFIRTGSGTYDGFIIGQNL